MNSRNPVIKLNPKIFNKFILLECRISVGVGTSLARRANTKSRDMENVRSARFIGFEAKII